MADNRYNQPQGFHGMSPMGPGMANMTTVRGAYVQPNMPMNPMMQQQMMMRFPMQGMQMGPPNTPPPPYSAHQPPGMMMANQPRTTLSKSKGSHQKSEKERFFEEQRQKLRQFGRPGAKKVDTDSLIGSMFKVDAKPAGQKAKGKTMQAGSKGNAEDDGFGEFLQGPASDPTAATIDSSGDALTDAFEENGEPSNVTPEEKKDLTSMMMECSDLTAPQKAKGFHKPTLNEVHKPRHHDRRSSFHQSDHSISWKSAKDMDGLFQLPAHTVAAPVPSQQSYPGQQAPPGQATTAVVNNNAFLAQGQTPPLPSLGVDPATGSAIPNNFAPGGPHHPQQPFGPPPTGPPPSYGEATASPAEPGAVNQTPFPPQATPPPTSNNMFAPPTSTAGGPVTTTLPEWCSYNETQVPPVYKQVLEASLVDGNIATDRLYPILLLSGLPREKLAHIWSLCNTGTPGLLVKTELWLILALIALTQNNYDTSRVDILARCPVPPVPAFPMGQKPAQQQQPPPPPNSVPPTQEAIEQHLQAMANLSASAVHPHTNVTPNPLQPAALPPHHSVTPPQFPPSSNQAIGGGGGGGGMATNQAATEDDFADFQAAPAGSHAAVTPSFNGKDMQQEDSFGEFIGGNGRGGDGNAGCHFVGGVRGGGGGGGATASEVVVESDPLDFPPYLPPRHCGERESRASSSMGNGHLPSCPSSHSHQRNNHNHHQHQHQQHNINHNNHSHPYHNQPPAQLQQQQQNPVCPHHHDGLYNADDSPDNNNTTAASSSAGLPRPVDNNLPLTSLNMPPGLSSISLDDKYSGNVRSFFCSSDSSTGKCLSRVPWPQVANGHTSPSFEDDDFTDGRDSFSQVSTSEQSEVDDIHNFEHYVEEFNHNKKVAAQDGSPLHCPFPSVQQNTSLDKQGPTHRNIVQPPAGNKTNEKGLESIHQPHSSTPVSTATASNAKLKDVQIPPPLHSYTQNTFPSNPSTSSNSAPANHGQGGDDDFEDFADFKSASSASASKTTASQSQSQSASDRYGALRDITQENDLMQSSVFAEPEASQIEAENGGGGDGGNNNPQDEDEEWANFTEAAAPATTSSFPNFEGGAENGEAGNQNDNHFLSSSDTTSSSSGIAGGDQQQASTSNNTKEGILKLFQTSSTPTPTSSSEGISAMVNSDSGYSTRSWGNNKSSDSTLTLTSTFDLSSPSPSGGGDNLSDSIQVDGGHNDSSFWNHKQITDSGIESNWASFGAAGNAAAPNSDQTSSLPPALGKSEGQEGEEDWGDFSNTTTSSSVNANANTSLPSVMENNNIDGSNNGSGESFSGNFGMANPMPATDLDVAGWASFSGAAINPNDLAGAATDANGANFVTIKKQNLGTNEIMGLFKVRDDPATMSGYQLPPTHSSPGSGKPTSRSRKSSSRRSHGRQVSSDLDDDMMPPPMDSDGDDGDDEHAFSRGYDLDDLMQPPPAVTSYNLFGSTVSSPVYSRAVGKSTLKLKDSKEDSGSVNSLELPSATQGFDGSAGVGGGGSGGSGGSGGGGDNHSMSSMELGTTNSGGMVSAESKSLDSLDFKTIESPTLAMESPDEPGKDGPPKQQQQQQQQHQPPAPPSIPHPMPIQPQELLASMPKLADKYNIDGLAQGNDRYSYEWEKCLEQCSQVLTEANTIFNNISSSAICNEVLMSLQGWEYVSCVIEIYRVACRVMTAMRSTAISSSELEQTLKEIDLMWNNLSAFLVGASLLPDPSSLVFTSAILKANQDSSSSSSVKTSTACGVCLLNVDVPTTTTTTTAAASSSISSSSSVPSSLFSSLASSSSSSSTLPSACIGSSITTGVNSKLSFAGRNYHSTCANFWVNCVDHTLPSLVLPELI